MARKRLKEGLQENIPDFEGPFKIYLLTKATKIIRGKTTDVSRLAPGLILQMHLTFFNVESIRGDRIQDNILNKNYV